jgi:hypothetical protein
VVTASPKESFPVAQAVQKRRSDGRRVRDLPRLSELLKLLEKAGLLLLSFSYRGNETAGSTLRNGGN